MFSAIRFARLRSLYDTKTLKLSKLNILLGANNTGKSSLLHGLLMLKQTLLDKDRSQKLVTSGPHVELGSFLDLVHDHSPENTITSRFVFTDPLVPELPKGFKFELLDKHFRAVVGCDVSHSYDRARNVVKVSDVSLLNKHGTAVVGVALAGRQLRPTGEVPQFARHLSVNLLHFLPTFLPTGSKPKDDATIPKVMSYVVSSQLVANLIANRFESLKYVAPVRERIPSYGVLGTMPSSEYSPSGQNLLRVLSSRTRSSARSGRTLLGELAYWLEKRFKLVQKVRLVDIDKKRDIKALLGRVSRRGPDVNFFAMGYGISQLVPVIVWTTLTPKDGCLLVEQPELHLHPKAQADLADLFVERAQRGFGQFIVETHSEHFLLRIRRRVAEGKIDPSLVAVFFFKNANGRTTITHAEIEQNGQVTKWPKGFFEEGYKEALGIVEAGLKGNKK